MPPTPPFDVNTLDRPRPTRRRLLHAVGGAGSLGALAGAVPASVAADPLLFPDLEWDAHVGDGVAGYEVSVEAIDDSERRVDPTVAFESGRVTVTVTRQVRNPCDTVRPLGMAYDETAGELAVDLVDIDVRSDDFGGEEACSNAPGTFRVDVAIDLAEGVTPASTRVAEYTRPAADHAPNLTVAYPDRDPTEPPAGVTDVSFETEMAGSRPPEEPPTVAREGDRIVVEGQVVIGSSSCKRAAVRRLEYDGGTLRVGVHDAPSEGSLQAGCTDDVAGESYRLELTVEDDVPTTVDVLESGLAGTRRRVIGDGDSPAVDYERLTSYEFAASSDPEADPATDPTVEFADTAITAEGVVPTCATARETLAPESLVSNSVADRLDATIADRTADVRPSYPDDAGCGEGQPAVYRLDAEFEESDDQQSGDGTDSGDGNETVSGDAATVEPLLSIEPFPAPRTVQIEELGLDHEVSTELRRDLVDEPPAPENLRVIGVTPEAVTVAWDPVEAADEYLLDAGTEHLQYTSEPHGRIGGLTPDTTYQVGVESLEGAVSSAETTVEVTTPPAYDEHPVSLDVLVAVPGTDDEGSPPREPEAHVEVLLRDLPEDAELRAYDVRLAFDDAVSVEHVDTPAWREVNDATNLALTHTELDESGGELRFEGTALQEPEPAQNAPITLASITLDSGAPGVPTATLEHLVGVEGTTDEPPSLGEYEPQSIDDDGLYRDVNGDGELGTADVSVFQEHLFSDAVQEQPTYFNFSGSSDGSVSHGDVIALFQDATGL